MRERLGFVDEEKSARIPRQRPKRIVITGGGFDEPDVGHSRLGDHEGDVARRQDPFQRIRSLNGITSVVASTLGSVPWYSGGTPYSRGHDEGGVEVSVVVGVELH
jgi:hypothetical protein